MRVLIPLGWLYDDTRLHLMENLAQEQFGSVMLRVAEELFGRVSFHDLPVVHEEHAVATLLQKPISWVTTIMVMPSFARSIMTSTLP